jgi:hypothetical protein
MVSRQGGTSLCRDTKESLINSLLLVIPAKAGIQ